MKKTRRVEDCKDLVKQNACAALYFYEEECTNCLAVSAGFQALASAFPLVKTYSIDVLLSPEIASAFDVESVPFSIFFKNGTVIDRVHGKGELFLRQIRSSMEKLTKKVHRVTDLLEFDTIKAVNPFILAYVCGDWVEDSELELTLEKLVEKEPTIKIVKLNVGECESIISELAISVLPCMILFKNTVPFDFLLPPFSEQRMQDALRFLQQDAATLSTTEHN